MLLPISDLKRLSVTTMYNSGTQNQSYQSAKILDHEQTHSAKLYICPEMHPDKKFTNFTNCKIYNRLSIFSNFIKFAVFVVGQALKCQFHFSDNCCKFCNFCNCMDCISQQAFMFLDGKLQAKWLFLFSNPALHRQIQNNKKQTCTILILPKHINW